MTRLDLLEWVWHEARNMSLGTAVDRLDSPPTPLQFMRDYVSRNKPCLVSDATSHWPALSRWPTPSYLSDALSSSLVSLRLTPDGRADSLVPHPSRPPPSSSASSSLCFAEPHAEPTPFPKALDLVRRPPARLVAYLQPHKEKQNQNGCFLTEYPQLASDCDADIPWASEALGCLPNTVEFWVGNHLSKQSCFRKYHSENLYAVISGELHFLLLPPTEAHRMYDEEYQIGQYSYSQESGKFKLKATNTNTFEPRVNPYPAKENLEREMAKFPLYFDGPKPFKVTVKAGQMLYLPAMWFHHVRRSDGEGGCTISVNYWYNMVYDIKCACFSFLELLPKPIPDASSDSSTSLASPCYSGSSSYQSTASTVEVKHPKQRKRKKNQEEEEEFNEDSDY